MDNVVMSKCFMDVRDSFARGNALEIRVDSSSC